MDNAQPSASPGSADVLDEIARLVLAAIAREEPLTPAAVTVLLRHYVAHGRDEVATGLSAALAFALDRRPSDTLSDDRPAWLSVFVEAQSVSDDERIGVEVAALADALRREWPTPAGVAQAMRSIAACLDAAGIAPRVQKDPPVGDGLLAAAIDELERIVGRAYEPGEGLSRAPGSDARGTLEDHVHTAVALLAGYRVTGRLPYSMLAEELMRFARRCWWSDVAGCFLETDAPEAATDELVAVNCDAVRVLSRISALHADPEYRQAVVVADGSEGVTNFGDADRILLWLGRCYRAHRANGAVAPEYAIALGERLSIR